MANGLMNQFSYSYEKNKTVIFGRVTIGASGAPTLDLPNSKGIASVVLNGTAGNYTITLKERFYRFFGLDARFLVASGLPASATVAVVSQAVNASTPTIVIQCSTGGVATNPASGEEMDLVIYLKNTSAL